MAEETEPGRNISEYKNKETESGWRPAEKWAIGTNFLLIIMGTVALCVYYGQLSQMRIAVDISKDSLVSVQRAFVTFKIISNNALLPQKPGGDKSYMFSAEWENLGVTPAKNVIQRFSIHRLPAEPDGKVFWGQEEISGAPQSPTVVGPKGTISVGPVIVLESYILPKIPARRRGTYVVNTDQYTYFWGWVAYRDIFPGTRRHVSEFCTYLVGGFAEELSERSPMEFKYRMCKDHNCTDEDCTDYEQLLATLPGG
jgi:hypothetical protein